MLKPRQCAIDIREYHSPLSDASMELRLDMNESTTGCSPRVLTRLQNIDAKKLALYAPREKGERMVATVLGRNPSQVMLTNGADEAIDLICRTYLEPGDEVITITPAFAMYEIFAQAAGGKNVRIPSGPDFSFPIDAVLAAINPRTRLIVITNPNNPTGAVTSSPDIVKVLQAAPDAAVLVDEAYFEFYGQTMVDMTGRMPNLFVARTFSKAYGLAGMRLGVLVGHAQHIGVIRRMTSPFNVNCCVLEVLHEALADQNFVREYVTEVRTTREWFSKEVEALGFKCWPSQANFVLVDFGERKQAILQQMREWGIALRDRPDVPGCVRITIGKQKEMDVVLMGLKQILANKEQAQPKEEQPAP